jgi:transcriptional regulator PpsR
VQVFKSPKESLGDLAAATAAKLIAVAADVAVVVDGQGVVRDVAFYKDELSLELDAHGRWLGSRLGDMVASDSQAKVKALLQDAIGKGQSVWRHVNHPSPGGGDIPILYAAVSIGRKDRFVMIGRDLRQVASVQQRLVEAQQAMERDYLRLRQTETRYRLLFHVASEAVMIVDASSNVILDANPAAVALLGGGEPKLLKSELSSHFDAARAQVIENTLAEIRATGRDGTCITRLAQGELEYRMAASLFRQEGASLFLVRVSPRDVSPGDGGQAPTAQLLKYFDAAADGLVITHSDGRIVRANPAFLEMAQLAGAEQARGESLERWLGRPGIDFSIALANLRQNGSLKLFATILRGQYGVTAEVEVSAVALEGDDGKAGFGFAIRNVEKRLSTATSGKELPRSIAQLTELIGRVPLRDLVRETTDVIEKLSIEAALELTGDNRASAAEMLGLSRQSLYVKLRRFGIDDHAAEDETDDD